MEKYTILLANVHVQAIGFFKFLSPYMRAGKPRQLGDSVNGSIAPEKKK
jgi:hypothetical protein